MFSKKVENTVRKGEIARNEQFLLFPQCFQTLVLQTRKTKSLFGKGLSPILHVQSDRDLLSPDIELIVLNGRIRVDLKSFINSKK